MGKIYRDVVTAGTTKFVKIGVTHETTPGAKRRPREKSTSKAVAAGNERNAKRNLQMILNNNFLPDDWHLILSYGGAEPTTKQARKDLDDFKRRMARAYKAKGKNLKWVVTTEFKDGRIHHHMVCSAGVSMEEILTIWRHGHVLHRALSKSGDYRELAAYMIKETSQTFREPDAPCRRRYCCSRSIERPVADREEGISAATFLKGPEPDPGYFIDPGSVFNARNELTGRGYLQYVMIKLNSGFLKGAMCAEQRIKISEKQVDCLLQCSMF